MLYMAAGDRHIVILETGNLEELKKGRPAITPDGEVLICWTPDPVWLADKILETNGDGSKSTPTLIAEAFGDRQAQSESPLRMLLEVLEKLTKK